MKRPRPIQQKKNDKKIINMKDILTDLLSEQKKKNNSPGFYVHIFKFEWSFS